MNGTLTPPGLTEPPAAEPFAGWGQSLYTGAAGIALAHIHAAHAGTGDGALAHQWIAAMLRRPISAHPDVCGLFYGAPAVAFVLHTADQPTYRPVLERLDTHITAIIRHRLARAHQRIDAGHRPTLAEYDLIRGLTGLGTYLLHRRTNDELLHNDLLREVLAYLGRLIHPLTANGVTLPGWWTDHGPTGQPDSRWPGGHANLGLAHGIAGPLALLATAARHGVTVDGQTEAIGRICAWLDTWRVGTGTRAWWPGMVSATEYRTGRLAQAGPQRPSWCYGTPGLARAQQLAGLALADTARQQTAQQALAGCIADPAQLAQLDDPAICHGWAGLLQTAWRMALDSQTSDTSDAFAVGLLACQMDEFLDHADRMADPYLLTGEIGTWLVHHTATGGKLPDSRWDTCLLLGS